MKSKSKKQQMRDFAASHRGEHFRLTALAAGLGWHRERLTVDAGHEHLGWNTKAARRLAKKCGARLDSVAIAPNTNAVTVTFP